MKIQIKATKEAAQAFIKECNKLLFSQVLLNMTGIQDIGVIECKSVAALEIVLVRVHQDTSITLGDVVR